MVVRNMPIPFVANLFCYTPFSTLPLIVILRLNDLDNHIISKR